MLMFLALGETCGDDEKQVCILEPPATAAPFYFPLHSIANRDIFPRLPLPATMSETSRSSPLDNTR